MPPITYEHLTNPQNTAPGVADSVFIAPVSWFDPVDGIKCKDISAPTATLADATVISEAHVFRTGFGFLEIICAPFKNTFASNTVGEVGSLGQEHTLELTIPGSYAKLHATIALLKNQPCIVLIKDSNCQSGVMYQLGCDCLFAWITAAPFSTGTTRSGEKGYKLTITAVSEAVFTYSGTVTLMPPPTP